MTVTTAASGPEGHQQWIQPLEPRRLMAITASFVEIPITPAAIDADPRLAGYRTFDLRVRIDAGDTWSVAQMHLTLRRGELYLPDPADHIPERGEWPSQPNVAFASVIADPDWFAPPEPSGNVFIATRADTVWFAIDPHETADAPRTLTLARLTLSSDAAGVVLLHFLGRHANRTTLAPTIMSDVYKGRAYRTNHGYISGTLFDDRNADGDRDRPDEEPLSGRTVYLDADNDGSLDAGERRTSTDAKGFYEFYGLGAGTYKVRQLVPTGFRQTTPHHEFGWSVPVWPGHIEQHKDFGSCDAATNNAVISGALFDDRNGDGVQGRDEYGLWDRIVYLDNNGDGSLSVGEPMTTADSGGFRFDRLSAGTWVVRCVARPGDRATTDDLYTVTLAPDETFAGIRFGVHRVL